MANSTFRAESSGRLFWPGGEARCALGRSGVTPAEAKTEGNGASPLGIWPMRQVFWRADRMSAPETALPVDALIPEAGWCDDPASPFYNLPVMLPFPMSHEKLWRDDSVYDLIVVLGYNDTPIVPGKGSAIFLHLARPDYSPTEGCVACAKEDLLALLKVASPGDALAIVS
jgi:L,D-peptidoglycan transpeptidase YkuD (ErfK/YbiS/YcfS/YnhG family)